jgi:hypothetical protein
MWAVNFMSAEKLVFGSFRYSLSLQVSRAFLCTRLFIPMTYGITTPLALNSL